MKVIAAVKTLFIQYFRKVETGTFMREKYESLALAELKEIAKARGMKRISGLKKAELDRKSVV